MYFRTARAFIIYYKRNTIFSAHVRRSLEDHIFSAVSYTYHTAVLLFFAIAAKA